MAELKFGPTTQNSSSALKQEPCRELRQAATIG